MPRLQSALDRVLIRLLSSRKGPAQAIRDARHLKELLRFAALFATLVLGPVLLLALLALRSLDAEALSLDANLQQRAETIATQVQRELGEVFVQFEGQVARHIEDPDPSATNLRRVVPVLRGVFRFDAEGELIQPFSLAPADPQPTPSARWRRSSDEAERRAARGEVDAALRSWDVVRSASQTPAERATAAWGRARTLSLAGRPTARAALTELADTFPRQRTLHGHRVADLALWHRAHLLSAAGSTDAAIELWRGLVERTLASTWVIGNPSDALLARRALYEIEDAVDPGWARLAARRLDAGLDQLFWATHLLDELRLVSGRGHRPGVFQYHAEERALWSTVRWGDAQWAFAFDYDTLQSQLDATIIQTANQLDPDLSVMLLRVDATVSSVLSRRSLAPELPLVSVIVRPTDPEALAAQRQRMRSQRRLVILLALLASALGIFAALRAVGREFDTARVKADFAANVSHELRSPITQIRLKAESLMLGLTTDEADRDAHYAAIVRESERLSRLVDNVLDFASIERGVKRYTLRDEPFTPVLERALDAARGSADPGTLSSDVVLDVDIPPNLPAVHCDREAIAQVLTNLLSNALKYGATGGWVGLRAWVSDDAVHVAVADRGIGMTEADRQRVFDHFFRAEGSDVRKERGTGIGLTIVRYIVDAHAGIIAVDSAPGEGSTFTVTLPIADHTGGHR